MDSDEKCEIKTVDFQARVVKESVTAEHDKGIPQVLRSMADYAAKNGVESVVIATIEKGNVCFDCIGIKDEAQKTLMALFLEDIRIKLKQEVFEEEDDEGDGFG